MANTILERNVICKMGKVILKVPGKIPSHLSSVMSLILDLKVDFTEEVLKFKKLIQQYVCCLIKKKLACLKLLNPNPSKL